MPAAQEGTPWREERAGGRAVLGGVLGRRPSTGAALPPGTRQTVNRAILSSHGACAPGRQARRASLERRVHCKHLSSRRASGMGAFPGGLGQEAGPTQTPEGEPRAALGELLGSKCDGS